MSRHSVMEIFEDCVGCRWTIPLLRAIEAGVCRPGALERALGGVSTKVLNERLARMVHYRLVKRHSYPEQLPRVEYVLTPLGRKVVNVLAEIEVISAELDTCPE